MDGGAWWATVHGIAKSRTLLSDFTFTFKEKKIFSLTDVVYCFLKACHSTALIQLIKLRNGLLKHV